MKGAYHYGKSKILSIYFLFYYKNSHQYMLLTNVVKHATKHYTIIITHTLQHWQAQVVT